MILANEDRFVIMDGDDMDIVKNINDNQQFKKIDDIEVDDREGVIDARKTNSNSNKLHLNFSVERLLRTDEVKISDKCEKTDMNSLIKPTPIRLHMNRSHTGSSLSTSCVNHLSYMRLLEYQQSKLKLSTLQPLMTMPIVADTYNMTTSILPTTQSCAINNFELQGNVNNYLQRVHKKDEDNSFEYNNNYTIATNTKTIYKQQQQQQQQNSKQVLRSNSLSLTGSSTNVHKRKRSWSRAVFSNLQRKGLEIQFQQQKYITKPDRRKLAARLNLTDAQVKVWFQNRRMKWRHTRENLKSGQEKVVANSVPSTDLFKNNKQTSLLESHSADNSSSADVSEHEENDGEINVVE